MSEDASIPLLNHELAADELAWMQAVYADFSSTRAAFSDPKEALRAGLWAATNIGCRRRWICLAPVPGGTAAIAMTAW